MSACGPSRRRSTRNGPSYPAPTTTSVVRPCRQRAAMPSGVGGSRSISSSSRADDGSPVASSSGVVSRSGASARATVSHQGISTRSGVIPAVPSDAVSRIFTSPAAQATTARHSSGSCRTSSSTHSTITPTAGPRRSRSTTAGSVRSRRAPSRTTRTSGVLRTLSRMLACRWSTSAVSSASRRPTESCWVPSASASGPPPSRACGSQRTQPQSFSPSASLSTVTRTSLGLCSNAACATIQCATGGAVSGSPATPTTPSCWMSSQTGTRSSIRGAGSSSVLSRRSSTLMLAVSSPSPTRSRR